MTIQKRLDQLLADGKISKQTHKIAITNIEKNNWDLFDFLSLLGYDKMKRLEGIGPKRLAELRGAFNIING